MNYLIKPASEYLFPESTFNSKNDVNPMRPTNIGGFYLNECNEKDYICRGWYL